MRGLPACEVPALPLGLLKRDLVPRKRLTNDLQMPYSFLFKPLLMKDEENPQIPHFALFCLYSAAPLHSGETVHQHPCCPLAPL
jgi:hypothetical protein